MSLCRYVHVHVSAGGQKRPSDPLELQLQVIITHPAWRLGNKPGSSARAVCAPNC